MTKDHARPSENIAAIRFLESTPLQIALALALLLLATVVAYGGIQNNSFHFDDWPNILDNTSVHMKEFGVSALLEAARGSFLSFRPIPSVTFAIDWWRGGGAPAPFLVSNLIIHCINAGLVFGLLLQIISAQDKPVSAQAVLACALAALWWAAQPIHVQAVSYIVQRMTELAALFSLLAVWFWLKARSKGGAAPLWMTLSLLSLALAALSKESAWITPLLLVIGEYLVLRNHGAFVRGVRDWIVAALLGAGAALLVADLLLDGPISHWALQGYERRDFTLMERLLTQPKVVLFHFSQVFWPAPDRFSLEHDVTIVRSVTDLQFWLPALILLLWCGAATWLATRPGRRIVAFFMLWMPVTLAIESSFIPLELVFEHRMYLPTVGLAGLLAIALERATRARKSFALISIALVTIATLHALWSTSQRIPQWRTEASLYEQATRLAPKSARTWNFYGIALLGQRRSERISTERFNQAVHAFETAMALDPKYPAPWTNRGVARYVHGDIQGALTDLRQAISLSSREAAAQHYLGEIYSQIGLHEDARIARRRACALGVAMDC